MADDMSRIKEWCCGVIFETREDGVPKTVVKYIYKNFVNGKRECLWATAEELYRHNVQPLKDTRAGWSTTLVGLMMNMYQPFLTPGFTLIECKNPEPLDEDGSIPLRD